MHNLDDYPVAFEAFDLGNGTEAISCTSGRTCHIVRCEDGTWIVHVTENRRVFPHRAAALDHACEIAGDPDLPPLSQI